MVTDISPIFGLQLVSLADIGVIATLVVASVIGITQGIQLYKQRQQQKRQTEVEEYNTRLESAHIVLDLERTIREEKMFRLCVDYLAKKDNFEDRDQATDAFGRFLGFVNTICLFRQQDVLSEYHMEQLYDPLLKALDKDEFTTTMISNQKNKFPALNSRLVLARDKYGNWG